MNISYLKQKAFRSSLKSIAYISLFPLIIGCQSRNPLDELDICGEILIPCLKEKALVEIKTNKGSVTIELNGESAPITAGNFLDLVNKGAYNGTFFDVVVNKPKPFIIRGGNLNFSIDKRNNNFFNDSYINSETGESRFIPLEIKLKREKSPRYNQIIDVINSKREIELTHKKGSISMIRSMELDSASRQFFISLRNLPELDGRYAVFGKIVSGDNILELINEGDYIITARKLTSQS